MRLEPLLPDRTEKLLAAIVMMIRNYGREERDCLPLDSFMQSVPTTSKPELSPEDRQAAEIANAKAAAAADKARRLA